MTSLAVAVELAGKHELDAWQGHEPPSYQQLDVSLSCREEEKIS